MRTIGLSGELSGSIRYQVLHRAASALIEAERFRADTALVMVHSFSSEDLGLPDFQAFTQLFGVASARDKIVRLSQHPALCCLGAASRHRGHANDLTMRCS